MTVQLDARTLEAMRKALAVAMDRLHNGDECEEGTSRCRCDDARAYRQCQAALDALAAHDAATAASRDEALAFAIYKANGYDTVKGIETVKERVPGLWEVSMKCARAARAHIAQEQSQ